MSAPSPTVALVCDAGAGTGLGHLSRCIALAEALVEQGAVARLVGQLAPEFRAILGSAAVLIPQGAPISSEAGRAARAATLGELRPDLVVIDSYEIGPDDVVGMSAGHPVCLIDDFGALGDYPCRAVLNFTVDAPSLPYPVRDDLELLLGPAWLLVRRAIRAVRADDPRPPGTPVARVLIAIGGEDRSGITARVARAVARVDPRLAIDVVLGRTGADLRAIEGAMRSAAPGSQITVGARSLAAHLGGADVVVAGGGLTKYEAAYVGRAVAVIDQTDEQAAETRAFVMAGLAVSLGGAHIGDDPLVEGIAALVHDADLRERLEARGRAVFPPDPTRGAAIRLLDVEQDAADGP